MDPHRLRRRLPPHVCVSAAAVASCPLSPLDQRLLCAAEIALGALVHACAGRGNVRACCCCCPGSPASWWAMGGGWSAGHNGGGRVTLWDRKGGTRGARASGRGKKLVSRRFCALAGHFFCGCWLLCRKILIPGARSWRDVGVCVGSLDVCERELLMFALGSWSLRSGGVCAQLGCVVRSESC